MAEHKWEIPMTAIGASAPLAEIAMSKGIFDDLLQVLREADADLAGVHDRHDLLLEPDEIDVEATAQTRKHIAQVYKTLTGQSM